MLVPFNWLKEFVDIRLAPKALADKLTMAGFEVESVAKTGADWVLDVNVPPNRGDCMSILGIAREAAAITRRKLVACSLKPVADRYKPQAAGSKLGDSRVRDFLSIELKDKKRCPRYTTRVITGVRIGPSPRWMAERLEACGICSINNIVDAANYLMLELGQPFHAFDLAKIRGKKIVVKTPKTDAKFTTLDGVSRQLGPDDLLICDAEGPVAIAGVMGGADSEITSDTRSIALECAYFDPVSIRRTSKRLGLATESSCRFERGIDQNSVVLNLNRLTQLILNVAGGTSTRDWIDRHHGKARHVPVRVSADDVNFLLGTELTGNEINKILNTLGLGRGVPSFRYDVTKPVDLIEEVARLYGYDKIPSTMPPTVMKPVLGSFRPDARAREYLADRGFVEVLNYGFAPERSVKPFETLGMEAAEVANPLGGEATFLKTTLIPGLLDNARLNINYGQNGVTLFEMRRVFVMEGGLIREPMRLAGLMFGESQPVAWWKKDLARDFYDMKGVIERLADLMKIGALEFRSPGPDILAPLRSAAIFSEDRSLGFIGELHPRIASNWGFAVLVFELYWDKWQDIATNRQAVFSPVPRFPSVRRDVALLLDENVLSKDVINAVKASGEKLVIGSDVFDVYKGGGIPSGKKSMAFAIWYAHPERTLTDEEINDAHQKVVGVVKNKFGAEIR